MDKQKLTYIVQAVLVVAALVLGFFGIVLPFQPELPDPLTREEIVALVQTEIDGAMLAQLNAANLDFSANTLCYREQGGAKWVCASGGEIEIQSGATLDVQSGATFAPVMTGLTLDGQTYVSSTAAITITGVLTDVHLIYVQN